LFHLVPSTLGAGRQTGKNRGITGEKEAKVSATGEKVAGNWQAGWTGRPIGDASRTKLVVFGAYAAASSNYGQLPLTFEPNQG
jgi:hypothetical protein